MAILSRNFDLKMDRVCAGYGVLLATGLFLRYALGLRCGAEQIVF